MAIEYSCPKCPQIFTSNNALEKHLARKKPCDSGKFQCDRCEKKYASSSSLLGHKKNCKGRVLSSSEKDQQIQNLKIALAAVGKFDQNKHRAESESEDKDIIETDDFQQSSETFIKTIGQEDMRHIRNLSIQELRAKIGLRSDPSTMIKLFRLIRLDESHPENHTILLPDINGDTAVCKRDDGWQLENFNHIMQTALQHDNTFLIRRLPDEYNDKKFQDGYLMNEIQQSIIFCNHDALKPIYDGLRHDLYDLTARLAVVSGQDEVSSE